METATEEKNPAQVTIELQNTDNNYSENDPNKKGDITVIRLDDTKKSS